MSGAGSRAQTATLQPPPPLQPTLCFTLEDVNQCTQAVLRAVAALVLEKPIEQADAADARRLAQFRFCHAGCTMQQLVLALMEAQRRWLYLRGIFANPDFSGQLGQRHLSRFAEVDTDLTCITQLVAVQHHQKFTNIGPPHRTL